MPVQLVKSLFCIFRPGPLSQVSPPSASSSLHARPRPPPLARGRVIVPVRPQQGCRSPSVRVSLKSVSAVTSITVATVSQRSWPGVGLEAGAQAGGVVGAHYLGLGHHTVLLLREGVAICRERERERRQIKHDEFWSDRKNISTFKYGRKFSSVLVETTTFEVLDVVDQPWIGHFY